MMMMMMMMMMMDRDEEEDNITDAGADQNTPAATE